MKAILTLLISTVAEFAGFVHGRAEGATNQRDTFVLWSNQVLSANLRYLREASLADEDYMFVELDNHTDKALHVAQAWLGLAGTRTDKQTQKSVFMCDMTGGVIYIGELPPGRTKAAQHGVFECGLANLGLPPKEGFHVELTPSADVRLADGTAFSTSNTKGKIGFEFRYPRPAEVESMKSRFKELLAHPDDQFASGYYMEALSQVPEVGDSVTFDELLSALKSHGSVDGGGAIMGIIGRRFPDDPRALSFFTAQLSRAGGLPFFSLAREYWHNPVFVEPLVERYERNGGNLYELRYLRTAWITNRQIVARLSTALLKGHPVLNHNVAQLSGTGLLEWCSAASEAAVIGDTNLLERLEPALDDRRTPPEFHRYSAAPRPPWNRRVCDCSLEAILIILDGDLSSAFKEAHGWRTEAEAYPAYDRVIAEVKKRLNR
jgi:hypothetical protein